MFTITGVTLVRSGCSRILFEKMGHFLDVFFCIISKVEFQNISELEEVIKQKHLEM